MVPIEQTIDKIQSSDEYFKYKDFTANMIRISKGAVLRPVVCNRCF